MKLLLALIGLEAAALITEAALVSGIGQQPIAAAMLTAPTSATALLGVAAVLARIAGHALVPAASALLLVVRAARCAGPRRRRCGTPPVPTRWSASRGENARPPGPLHRSLDASPHPAAP